jgi:hypothetical protein
MDLLRVHDLVACPLPSPPPQAGEGTHRVRGGSMHQGQTGEPYPGLLATPASAKVAIPA